MRTYRRAAASLGILLLLPLVGAVVWSFSFTASCEYDCGDMGGRGLFLLVLLCTPPAAVGVLMLATADGQRSHRLVRLVTGLIMGGVVLCTLVLVICAIAALAEGITELTTEPGIHRIGQTEPSAYDRAKQREAGIWWLIIATLLTAMATTAVLALRAAWRKRR
jgi:Na+-driven multidrug efflux pump